MSEDSNNQDVLILIPARYASTRFPGKPLSKISDKSMIQRVYENCKDSGFDTFVVTDDDRIEKHLNEFSGNVLRIDDDVPSGTERIYLAWSRHLADKNYRYIINVQGDEPLLQGNDLRELVTYHKSNHQNVSTLVRRMQMPKFENEFQDSNKVKAILGAKGKCLYFSRSPIPFDRTGELKEWFLHIGVYCYDVNSLEQFCESDAGKLEQLESLEQLRLLAKGHHYGARIVEHQLIGVDTPEDIVKVEKVLNGEGNE